MGELTKIQEKKKGSLNKRERVEENEGGGRHKGRETLCKHVHMCAQAHTHTHTHTHTHQKTKFRTTCSCRKELNNS